jgi:hypothetical protein
MSNKAIIDKATILIESFIDAVAVYRPPRR